MAKETERVSITLTRGQWNLMLAYMSHAESAGWIRQALNPAPAMDPRAPIVPPKPKGDGWPALKSAQEAGTVSDDSPEA